MEKQIDHDVYSGIVLLIISIFGLFLTRDLPGGADMFPNFLFILLGVLAIFIMSKGIIRSKDSEKKKEKYFTLKEVKLPFIVFSLVVIYGILINILGFFVSSIMFVPAFMVFYRDKNIKNMIITIAVMVAIIYLVFVQQLNVQLPTGLLF